MVDSWFQMNLDLNLVEPQYTDELDFIQKLGITCNSSLNTWSKYYNKLSFTGDRLDYIFYFQTPQLQCISSSVTFIDYINSDNSQLKSSFSDHFGVKSIFKLMQKNDHYQQQPNGYDNNNNDMIFPSLLNNPTYTLLSLSTVQALIYILQEEHYKIQQNYKRLLSLFIFLLCSIIILYIIQVVLPYKLYSTTNIIIWLLPIFTGLLLIACSALAIICLVVGFVFGFGESQSMYQFILDLQTLLQGIQLRNKKNASLTLDDI